MPRRFLEIAVTPSVLRAQEAAYGRARPVQGTPERDALGPAELEFIAARDSFYLASVSESGWPYVQHRGGPQGFLKVLDDKTLAFADFAGNRQYISLGNVGADDRVALFLMDYPNRARLKILAHMQVRDLAADPDLAARLIVPGYKAKVERAFVLTLEAFDWNCPQHITPRFTGAEIEPVVAALQTRIAVLEAENEKLRAQLA